MTKILFPRIGKPYENDLLQHLEGLPYPPVEIVQYSTEEESIDNFCMHFESLCTNTTDSTSDIEDVRIIVDIENQDVIKSILQILPLAIGLITSRPSFRIIVVTTLLTWCGDSTRRQIMDAEVGFTSRIPLQSLLDLYALENALWKVATDLSSSTMSTDGPVVCFAGVGLLYGRDGGDFASAYRLLWDEMCNGSDNTTNTTSSSALGIQLPFLDSTAKDNNVLAIHVDDFLTSISYLLLSSTGTLTTMNTNITRGGTNDWSMIASMPSSPLYFPLVDSTPTPTPTTAVASTASTTRNSTANSNKGGNAQGTTSSSSSIADLPMVNCNAFEARLVQSTSEHSTRQSSSSSIHILRHARLI